MKHRALYVIVAFLPFMALSSAFTAFAQPKITVIASDGKTAYEGEVGGVISPFEPVKVDNPNGVGTIEISQRNVAELSFVKVDKSMLTDRELELIKGTSMSVDDFLKRYPLRIMVITTKGEKFRLASGVYDENADVSFRLPDDNRFSIKAKDLKKIIIHH